MDYREAMTLMAKVGGINILVGEDSGCDFCRINRCSLGQSIQCFIRYEKLCSRHSVGSNIIRVATNNFNFTGRL